MVSWFSQGGAKKVAKARAPVKVEGSTAVPEGAPAVVKKTK